MIFSKGVEDDCVPRGCSTDVLICLGMVGARAGHVNPVEKRVRLDSHIHREQWE